MRGYRTSSGGVQRLASGGLQSSATGSPCCCGGFCDNNTGCGNANTLCTGYRFLFPSATLTISPISQTYEWGVENSGTWYLFTPGGVVDNFNSSSATAVTMDVDLSATIVAPAPYDTPKYVNGQPEGKYRKIIFGSETHEFDTMSDAGVTMTLTPSSRNRPIGNSSGTISGGIWDGQAWDGSQSFSESAIFEQHDYEATANVSAISTSASYTGSFSGTVQRFINLEYSWQHVRHDPGGDVTTQSDFKSILNQLFQIGASLTGNDEASMCGGGLASWTHTGTLSAANYDQQCETPLPASPPPPTINDTVGSAITSGFGTGQASIGTTWSEQQVGCRECSRAIVISGVYKRWRTSTGTAVTNPAFSPFSYEDAEAVDVAFTGRLKMSAVPQCGAYLCEWYGTVTFTEPGRSPYTNSARLVRHGPTLYRFVNNVTTWLKITGECPTNGIVEVMQDLNPHRVTGGGYFGAMADIPDAEYELHPVFSTHISEHTVSISADTLTGGEGPYYCDEEASYAAFDTGEVRSEGIDLKYEIENANESGVYVPFVLSDYTNPFAGFWVTPTTGNSWGGATADNEPVAGTRNIRTTVTVTGVPGEPLVGRCASDDQVVAITINGVLRLTSVTPATSAAWEGMHEYELLPEWFDVGANTVVFTLLDTSSLGDGGAAAFYNEFDV